METKNVQPKPDTKIRLNPKKPHGVIFGSGEAKYVQDGHTFDSQGRKIG